MNFRLFRFPAQPPADVTEWAVRLRSPEATDADRAAFRTWLASSQENRKAFEEERALWRVAAEAKAQHKMLDKLLAEAEGESAQQRAAPHAWFLGNYSLVRFAGVAAVAVVAVALTFHLTDMRQDSKIATRPGEQRMVRLDDGSTIQLNTGTRISYHVDSKQRRVSLEQGEAFFDVAKDPSRRFVVQVGRSEIRVLGTQFSVRQNGERLEVVVKEGRVEVIPEPTLLSTESNRRVELVPGSRLELERERIKVAAVDVNRTLAWRSGEIEFQDELLEDVVAELNRYSEAPMVIEDGSIRRLRVSGIFKATDMSGIQFMLRESLGVEFVRRDDRIAVLAPKR